jgi:hypothetical protein
VVAATVVLAGSASLAKAGPATGLCSMDTSRGAIPVSFAIDACFDGHAVWLRNDLSVPIHFAISGDTGARTNLHLDQSLAALATRAHYPDPLLLLPHDVLRIAIGTGAARITLADTDAGGYYALATTIFAFLPAGVAKAAYDSITGMIAEFSDDFAKYANCTKTHSSLICKPILVRDVTFAVGRAAVGGLAKGIVSLVLNAATFAKWANGQPSAIKKILGSDRTLTFAAASGAAASQPGAGPATVQSAGSASNPIVLVVDISGSMGDDDGTGRIKIDGAKLALLNFLQQVEPGTPIGLRTYPDQSGGSCNTGTVRFPIAARDPATMSAVIRSLQPDGDTPTAEAMRAAANELKAAGYTHGTLVIVSDGESTCSSPCDAAQAIAKSGIDLQTITVGFRISPAGQKELQCIANAMNGTYVDASDSAGLKQALARVSRPTLTVRLTYPSKVVAEVAADPQGLVDVTGEITNTANQQARNVVTTMHFDGVSPGLTRPVLYLGNLDPGGSRTVSWSFRPGILLAGSSVAFSVGARADNTLSDGTASGSITVEQVNTATQAGPILRDRHQLAILGDSYSSGEGSDRYIAGTDTSSDGCHRSEFTYLIQAFHQPDSSVIACSGAIINDIYFPNAANNVSSQLDQVEHLQRTRGVDAVVMTLGGNNALFSHLAVSCLLLDCTKAIVTNFSTPWDHVSGQQFIADELNSDLRDSLTDVYTNISGVLNSNEAVKKRGSVAPILVVGYASPIPLTGRSCLGFLDQLTRDETAFIGQFVTSLNGLVEAAVDSARQRNVPVFYVPNTEDAFQPDHTICDAHPYARGLTSFNGAGTDVTSLVIPWTRIAALKQLLNRGKQELLHPNVQGYEAETNAIIRWSLSPAARADAAWLNTGEAAQVPALPISTSNDDLGQLGPGSSPVLQGGTSYPLTVEGFAPDSNVEIIVRSQPLLLAEVRADTAGTVRTRVGLPPTLLGGRHTLELRGEARDEKHSRIVTIPFRIKKATDPVALRAAYYGAGGSALVAVLAWSALGLLRRRDDRARS